MAKIACQGCTKPMSDQAVVCPHCGARQTERDPLPEARALDDARGRYARKPLTDLKQEEVSALIASEVRAAHDGRPRGIFAGLVLPSPRSAGPLWWAEVTLTVVGLPLVAGAALVLSTFRRALRRHAGDRVGDLTNTVLALGPGNLGLYWLLDLVEVPQPGVWLLPPSIAVLLRTVIRALARR